MKSFFLMLAAAMVLATPAAAQIARLPAGAPSPQDVLTKAPADAAALFAFDGPRGLVHRPSGYACPAAAGSAALMSVAVEDGIATCLYEDSFQPVIRLQFLPNDAGDPLTRAYCEALPRALHLDLGPPLPTARRLEGPSTPAKLGEVQIQGRWESIRQCIWARAPFHPENFVVDAAALRPEGRWAARMLLTPAQRVGGRNPIYSIYDMLRPIFVLGAVVGGEDAPHR